MKEKDKAVYAFLEENFPHAKCALNYRNEFECLIAVILSAQTTDKKVNSLTPILFEKYPTPEALKNADQRDVEEIIKPLGLFKNKAKNIVALSKVIQDEYSGRIPLDFETLISLPGVGIKTANVVLAELASRPAIAVDTHVARVAKRLRYAYESDEPPTIEKKLEKAFPRECWIKLHHRIIFFGREICHAKKPECDRCSLGKYCAYSKKARSTASK